MGLQLATFSFNRGISRLGYKVISFLVVVLITIKLSKQSQKKRVLLKRLQDELHLPILGLIDWNVGGLGVMLTYKYGSVAMGLEAFNYSEY